MEDDDGCVCPICSHFPTFDFFRFANAWLAIKRRKWLSIAQFPFSLGILVSLRLVKYEHVVTVIFLWPAFQFLYFCFANCVEGLLIVAILAVVNSYSWLSVAYYSLYWITYDTCELVLAQGFSSYRPDDFCMEDSFPTICFLRSFLMMAFAGCIFRHIKLDLQRRSQRSEENEIEGEDRLNETTVNETTANPVWQ